MSGVVLMYHRVATLTEDPYGLAVHPRRFAEQVRHLSGLGCVVPLSEMIRRGRAATIALTFDDGYADNATLAAPLLAQAGLPATFFITTRQLGARRFWWDRLAAAFLGEHVLPDGVEVSLGGPDLWLALHNAEARRTALRFLHRRLRPLPPDDLQAVVDDLLARLAAPVPPDHELSMTVDQLRTLAQSPLADIGAHTRTHLQLAGQREVLQRKEIVGSVEDLRVLLERPVTSFAYPFGTRGAVGELAPRLVQEAGCRVACSTQSAAVTGRSDPYRLPRLNVRDWSAAELDAQIRRLTKSRWGPRQPASSARERGA